MDAEEFILFIRLLTGLPSMNTLTGRQDLVTIIMAQSDLDKPFDAVDIERLMILLSCIQEAIPLFSVIWSKTAKLYRKTPYLRGRSNIQNNFFLAI